jgi:translation initiation factor IF-3
MDETNFEGRSLRSKEAFIRSRLDKNRVYRNEAIPFPYVQLKHPSARNLPGMMHPPAPLSALLPLLAEGNYLELTAHTPYVVVEYRNHAAEVEQARKKKGAPKAPETKEIQLTWAVSDGDLSHKLEKTRSSLLEGARVDLVFGPKKRTPLPTPERREEILTKSLELLTDVAVERSPRKDEKLMSSLFLQRNPSISVADAAKLKPQKEMSGLEAYLASHGST